MTHFRRIAHRHLVSAALLGVLICAPSASGQDVTESSLKAAFIHNFIRFTEWPRDVLPPAAPLTVCVLGNAAFGDVLEGYVQGHPVDGHVITVTRVVAEGVLRSCHLLYLSGMTLKQAGLVVAGLNGISVLTLSDVDQFARAGGMAQLTIESGRIRFKINLDNARRSRLQLSSKLLSLATIVKDDPNAMLR